MANEGNSLTTVSAQVKRRVSYYYDPEIGNYYHGKEHVMKPHRIRMTHELIKHYGLLNEMEIHKPMPALDKTLLSFHTKEYVDAINGTSNLSLSAFQKHGDCPMFDGLASYCKTYAGASIGGAIRLNHGLTDIAINWAGGLHHAKKGEASGFCYINDIVLAILELLKYHQRVLYVDIDVHHGDGVEEAFYMTDRVMTASYHKFGNEFIDDKCTVKPFFPGTGHHTDRGLEQGEGYAVNVTLDDGVDDDTYWRCFKSVMDKVMAIYSPEVVVLQCGADSLAGDLLGPFNLTIEGHAKCVNYMRSFNLPLLLLGGGGYTIENVARCWCYETGIALGKTIGDKMPEGVYSEYFGPEYKLHFPRGEKVNRNASEKVDDMLAKVLESLSALPSAPSVQFQERLPNFEMPEEDEEA